MENLKYPKYLESGMEFGKLTVVCVDSDSTTNKSGKKVPPWDWKYFCKCSCGKLELVSIRKSSLVTGVTTSCGCYQKKVAKKNLAVTQRNRRKSNRVEVNSSCVKIYFENNPDIYTSVDLDDFQKVKDYYWMVEVGRYTFYAVSSQRVDSPTKRMHQLIMGVTGSVIVDHKDGNGLNNRRDNLRIVTNSQNSMNQKINKNNTSGITGVYWSNYKQKWMAQLKVEGKYVLNRAHTTKEEAVKARKEAEEKYFGEFSFDNSRDISLDKSE